MKTCVLLLGLLAAVSAMPYTQEPEFAMVPDIDGWKLVNINEDPEPENFYNPETDIEFTLFTRSTVGNPQVIRWNDPASIRASAFNPNNPTRMTIHGWNGGAGGFNTAVHNALFAVGDFNCITVNWGAGAQTPNYLAARNRVGPTGTVAGNLLRMISLETGQSLESMTIIGHSLGSHVAGFAGKALSGRLGAIVATDAAGPLFSFDRPDGRVDYTDAIYVESIHTNAGVLGIVEPIGHANFYPNGGRSQPGCGIDLGGSCAHARSNHLYIESIASTAGFWARRCNGHAGVTETGCESDNSGPNTVLGGEPLVRSPNGVYWMRTNSASPFAQGQAGMN